MYIIYNNLFVVVLCQVSKNRVNCVILWDSGNIFQVRVQGGGTVSQHAAKQSHMSLGWGQPIRFCSMHLSPQEPNGSLSACGGKTHQCGVKLIRQTRGVCVMAFTSVRNEQKNTSSTNKNKTWIRCSIKRNEYVLKFANRSQHKF